MKSFVACVWPEHDREAAHAVSRLEALFATGMKGYGVAERKPGFLIAAHRVPVRASPQGWYLVGDVFDGDALEIVDRVNASATRAGVDEFGTYCQHLADNRWGRYLALLPCRSATGTISTFVDPIGMREVVTWQAAGIRLFTSDPATWLAHLPPPELAIDVGALDKLVTSRVAITDFDPFAGVTRLEPGIFVHWSDKGRARERRIWMPHALCRRPNTVADGHDLGRRVDECVRAWSQTTSASVVELSGGLDSAMVAASLARTQPPSGSFSAYSDGRAGDERRFSRAIAGHLQIHNHEYALPSCLDERVLAKLAVDWKPGIGSATLFHDAALADYGVRLGAETLFTGRGGDAVFFQHPTGLVAADPWPDGSKDHRERSEALAQWSRSSVWAVARHAWLPSWSMQTTTVGRRHPSTGLLGRAAPGREAVVWSGPLHRLSPVKRMQVEAIGGDRSAFGPSHCTRKMDVIHPLLSQPIVEYGLSISAMTLTAGRRDRALAREGFAQRLPAAVLTRRGKGSLTTYFGRTLAKSTPFLREYLLGGALNEARLIDQHSLSSSLTPEYLMQHDCYAQVIALLQIEAWLRTWRVRLAQPQSSRNSGAGRSAWRPG